MTVCKKENKNELNKPGRFELTKPIPVGIYSWN
jgi:hypothetical protein